MARPTKYTPDRAERFLNAIRAGNTRRAACDYAGITEQTLGNWQRRYFDFFESLTRAEAESEIALVAQIRQDSDWHAKAWLLERRWADSWGKREKVEITIRQHAERLAAELGLSADEIIEEAERIVSAGT